MVILAVDVGKRRTGVAVCDKDEILAYPKAAILEHNAERIALRIIELIGEHKAEILVVGLPLNMDGTEGESAMFSREIADLISEKSEIKIEFMDERLSTVMAHQKLHETGLKMKNHKDKIDSQAAVIILENFLRKRKNLAQ